MAASSRTAWTTSSTCGFSRRSAGGGRIGLGGTMRRGLEQHLPLQVGHVDAVVVDHPQRADAGRGQVEQQRAAEAAGADHQDPGGLEPELSDAAELGQHDVARVAPDLRPRSTVPSPPARALRGEAALTIGA